MTEGKKTLLEHINTFAFVGEAGTGKSQRAQYVAALLDADYIIDDGLVIHKGSIVCGKSAKSELNRVSAIRRAIFDFDDHREEVTKLFSELETANVMIIATSISMVKKITQKLGLPYPKKIIRIEEISTVDEIKKARYERYAKGQHVIPVAKALVRKNFAGKLVGQLRVFWNNTEVSGAEKTIVRPPFSFYGEVHIEPVAIEQLIAFVASRTTQVAQVCDIWLSPQENGLTIELKITVMSGDKNLLEVAQAVKKRVSVSIKYFTGLDIRKTNVIIAEVLL